MRFSPKYKSFNSWLRASPRNSSYARTIISRHRLSPKASLSQLRTNAFSTLSAKSWTTLTSSQKADRKASLEALRMIRAGTPLSTASRNVGLSPNKVIQHLGKNVYKSKGKWRAKVTDSIHRSMHIYSKGRLRTIILKNSADASLIGSYFADVRYYLSSGDQTVLMKYRGVNIIDAEGKAHPLETDPQTIRAIEDGKENPEFFEVYSDE